MPAAAILPVKQFGEAKQRLAGALGAGTRTALAGAMVADVLTALERAEEVEAVIVVSSEPAAVEHAKQRELILVPEPQQDGQSSATLAGLARASALGFGTALLVPGDCPMMDPGEIDALARRAAERDAGVLVVPDRHGTGTNALAVDPCGRFEPQFGPGSLARHTQQAETKGLRCRVEPVPSLALDVDTPDDLAALMETLRLTRGGAARTRGILSQIERTRVPPTVAA